MQLLRCVIEQLLCILPRNCSHLCRAGLVIDYNHFLILGDGYTTLALWFVFFIYLLVCFISMHCIPVQCRLSLASVAQARVHAARSHEYFKRVSV